MATGYEEYCDWYAVHGDPQRDAMDYEMAAQHDRYDGWRNEINLEGETYVPEIDDLPPTAPQDLGGGDAGETSRNPEDPESLPF